MITALREYASNLIISAIWPMIEPLTKVLADVKSRIIIALFCVE